tara:strand:+ start:1015 stop:2556 length:1542 start_codon:yes stop_codon:yes gene_type:complete
MKNNCPFDLTPLDQSGRIQNREIISLNYTNQDFHSMKVRAVDFIKARFGNDFTDFIESDLAFVLIETWAFLADTLSFKQDQLANEIFIDTVSELENAFRLSKLVGFEPTPPIASRSMWSASIGTLLSNDLILPTPILISTGPIDMELFPTDEDDQPVFDKPIIIQAGSLINNSVIGLEGLTNIDLITGTGEVNQAAELSNSPVIFDSVRVKVDGVPWERVDYFTESQPRKEFRVEFNSDYAAFVMFGSSRAGYIPTRGSEIEVTYRVGGGIVGNITTGAVDQQLSFDVPSVPFRFPVSFRNYTKGEFGYEGDGIEEIREDLPRYLRTQDRAVTGNDYKSLVDLFATPYSGQIGKSTVVLRNHGCAGNVIDIYVLARENDNDLVEASDTLKNELIEELDAKKMLTDYICIRDGVTIPTDVNVDITLDKIHRQFEIEIRERVERRVEDFFRLTEWDYGDNLKEADLIKALSDVREILSIDATFTTDEEDNSGDLVSARFFEIIRPAESTITFVYE